MNRRARILIASVTLMVGGVVASACQPTGNIGLCNGNVCLMGHLTPPPQK